MGSLGPGVGQVHAEGFACMFWGPPAGCAGVCKSAGDVPPARRGNQCAESDASESEQVRSQIRSCLYLQFQYFDLQEFLHSF